LLEDYGKQIDETGIRYLKQIKGSSEKMDVLIEELLKLSRVG
jgi:signal transduction histidine kinase